MALTKVNGGGVGTLSSGLTLTSDDPTITMTDSSGTNDIATLQATSGALIVTARDGSADGEIIFKKTDGSATDETMRIDNSGAVQIKSTGGGTPTYSHTNNGEGITFRYNDDSGARAADIVASGNTPAGASMNMRFHLSQSGADAVVERMRIDDLGRVTIGHTSSINIGMLGVSNRSSGSSRMIAVHNAAGTSGYFNQIAFRNNADSANIGDIVRVNDASVQYNTSSDYRLKTAVTYDWDATSRLKQLKPARFKWICEGETANFVDGFLAHEAQTVVPEAVSGTHDEVDDDDNPVYQGIDQAKLVPLLVKTLQEAITKIETLEAKVQALEDA